MAEKSMGTVRGLLKVFVGLVLWTGLIVAVCFWIDPVLGTIVSFLLAFLWTFGIAPRLAGQMVAALILARNRRQMAQRKGGA